MTPREPGTTILGIAFTALPLGVVIAGWWLVASVIDDELTLPTPPAVVVSALDLAGDGVLMDALGYTVRNTLIAFGLAAATGVIVGVAMGRVTLVRLVLQPVVSFLFTTPKSAFFPAMLLLFGLGAGSQIALAIALAFFPIVLSTSAAAARVDRRLVWSARSLGTSRLGVFVRVVLPATAPGAVAGLRVGLIAVVVGEFTGEMISGSQGLGQLMSRARTGLDSATVYVAIVAIALMALALNAMLAGSANRLLRWAREE
jgi:ABC-type nitrate/sulfonate/bicarbonate transport system permease component